MFDMRWDGISFYIGLALLFINGILGAVWGALQYLGVYVDNFWLLGVGGLGIVMALVPVVWRYLVPYPDVYEEEIDKCP